MKDARARALRFVVVVGVVSLFADMTYEGSRGITGPFLAALGATGAAVGIVAGLGELAGYALRLVSGRLSDRPSRLWPITLTGYTVQMLSVPALALATTWHMAAGLIILERLGKAIRKPPRDAMLASATAGLGRGYAFGLHEALDQIGALAGPLLAAGVLAAGGRLKDAFAWLLAPALITLALLVRARFLYPRPEELHTEETAPAEGPDRLPRAFWLYLAGAGLVAAGFADYSLVSFHFARAGTVSPSLVPVLYSLAMGASGAGSLLFGRWFDRSGMAVLAAATALTAFFSPLVFLGGGAAALAGSLLWGLGMGAHESVMSAAVAGMVPPRRLAWAYGVFHAGYGVSWFAGSALLGWLYDVSPVWTMGFALVAQLAAVPFFLLPRMGAAGRR